MADTLRYKFVSLLLLPAMLLAQLACTCLATVAPPVAGEVSTPSTCGCGMSKSACCDAPTGDTPAKSDGSDCSHCGEGIEVVVTPERSTLAKPIDVANALDYVVAWADVLLADRLDSPAARPPDSARLRPPVDVLRVTCALLI